MNYKDKTKEQLINESAKPHQHIEDLSTRETGRKQADEALKVSEIRYRRFFETAQDGILLLDADTGQILDVNQSLLKMLGYSQTDFLGKKLWEIGPFSDVAASRLSFSELQTKGYVRYEHLPLEAKDGHLIDVEFVSNVYIVDKEKIIQCNVRDISLRKQAEDALREAYTEMDLCVKERTAELTRANERLSQEIEDRKQAANSLRAALTIIKQLKDSATETEATDEHNYDKRRYANLLQGLGQRAACNLQPWLAAERGRVGRSNGVSGRSRIPPYRS